MTLESLLTRVLMALLFDWADGVWVEIRWVHELLRVLYGTVLSFTVPC
jgi:hypothetical protein